ncbi:hypothetical protein IMCC26134_00085 [Verrucomicrobia bacterium IMCC26134]|jgi:uncharacterized repeat protein (TIGR04138 family)|nr:hypothetical protein IMCC26134_00085 [Verrucomicrobia bacterium IMCC26134]
MGDLDVNEIIALIRKEDPRFDRLAYAFVRDGLEHAVKELRKRESERAKASSHLTGRELSDGLRAYALDQFGPLAKTVLNGWGITETIHFGDIVYNLIDYNVFSKTESDRREDFEGIFTFEAAFVAPFQPRRRRLPLPSFAETE